MFMTRIPMFMTRIPPRDVTGTPAHGICLRGVGLTVLFAMVCANSGTAAQRVSQTERHMGVRFSITVYADSAKRANEATRMAFARIADLDGRLSHYRPDSELSRLARRSPHEQFVPVSEDLYRVLSRGVEIGRLTDGAFDITVGPLVRLWRRSGREKRLPSDTSLRQAATSVGYEHIQLDPRLRAVRLTRPGMRLDLGGIAKGYALDEAMEVLQKHGVTMGLVDGGGDVVVGDPPPGRLAWQVGIVAPTGDRLAGTIGLANRAVATSGDLYRYVEIDGVRYAHIIDPRTGLGITEGRLATVIAADGMTADALASALCVMEVERGIRLIERLPQVEARLMVRSGRDHAEPREFRSSGFPAIKPLTQDEDTESRSRE